MKYNFYMHCFLLITDFAIVSNTLTDGAELHYLNTHVHVASHGLQMHDIMFSQS